MHPSRLLVFYAFVVWTTVLFACGTYTGSIKRRSLLVTMMKAAGDNLQHDKGVCLMAKKITDTVTWVGKVDWELNEFHGHEYSTEKGSSYNAYLIRDKKTVLMDTVWKPYDDEFVENLKKEIDLHQIDYIVMNHNENDHSGALPALMAEIPDTPIYCTKKGEAILRGLYHKDWNFVNVKTGDTLDLGTHQLIFIEAPMLHWPYTMFTYMTGENILFSNDGFGQHFASEDLFKIKPIRLPLQRGQKYYANILNLYSPMVTRKIDDSSMNVLFCDLPSSIWKRPAIHRKGVSEMGPGLSGKSGDYPLRYVVTTRRMAEKIAEGIKSDPTIVVKLLQHSR